MDEPLSNLDAKLRVSTRAEISQLQRRLNTTMLYVTHDQTEAMTMADRIAVLEGGDMQQVGTPEELYLTPANTFVATFIGTPSMNMMTGTIEGNEIAIGHIRLPLPALQVQPTSTSVVVGVRPENIQVVGEGQGDTRAAAAYVENFGSDKYIHANIDGLNDLGDFIIRTPNTLQIAAGNTFEMRFERDFIHLFDAETTMRIN